VDEARLKDYRARSGATGCEWIKTMTLPADEFIRRFLLHVLPDGIVERFRRGESPLMRPTAAVRIDTS
jgi:putative transposase